MKAEEVNKILAKSLKKIRKHFEKLQEGFNQDSLHDCRLEMKRLKAFMRLLNTTASRHKKLALSKTMKTFYTLTGNLRNLELHEQRIRALVSENKLKEPVDYLVLLNQEKRMVVKQLQTAMEKLSFYELSKHVLTGAPANLSALDSQNYLAQQLNVLTGIFVTTSYSDEALHEVRKIIKDIGYNRNYLGTYLSLLLPISLIKKDQVDALAEKLGMFHDLFVSLHLLQSPIASQVREQEERGTLQALISIIEADKKSMKKELVQQLSSI